jgi:hypothetical protein
MRWAAMEVCSRLKMTLLLGSYMSVVEGGLKWLKGTVAGAWWGFCAEAPAWQHPWRLLACHIGKIGKLE